MSPSLPTSSLVRALLVVSGLGLTLLAGSTIASAQERLPLAAQPLQRGQRYLSPSGGHYLVFQPDGNLVVYTAGDGFVWGLNTVTDRFGQIARVELQPDGNLAAYDAGDGYVWSALTENPDPGSRLELNARGALQIVSGERGVLWSSDGNLSAAASPVPPSAPAPAPTPAPAPAPASPPAPVPAVAGTATGFPLTAGQTLARGAEFASPSGNHRIAFHQNGNLVVARADGGYVWGFDTVQGVSYPQVDRVAMQPDGNFVALNAGGAVIWRALPANPDPAARLELNSRGALQLVSPGRGVLWSSDGVLLDDGVAGTGFPFTAGQTLPQGTDFLSPSENHKLSFQTSGNLVVASPGGGFVWGFNSLPNVDHRRVRSVRMSPDGNLVALGADGRPVWQALASNPDPSARLELTYNGALQLVSDSRGILWSSDGILTPSTPVATNATNTSPCEADAGWSKCLLMAAPAIRIVGSERVTDAAMNTVANVYAELFGRLQPAFPRSTFDGFRVYITNGESEARLRVLSPISPEFGTDGYGPGSRAQVRGGANGNFLWLEEQMICKEGIVTRNEDFAAGRASSGDNRYRSFDQVIHELGHSIESRYNLATRLRSVYSGDPTEQFPQGIQSWFGAPVRAMDARETALMESLFTSRAVFSCEGYAP